uniref:BESS domain-containing protein n=2 Tax=Pyxicephalus adspersus TaxID=30357 RepID=A0AAV2ZUK4_PYXAD|nr:TPA: hypothetical protein GDO54_004769 [Pyxicephalus adspersus]
MKKKWKSLRDRFKKDLKMEKQSQSGQGPMKYKFHPLYHELSFLIPSLARGPTGNAEDDDDDENESQPQQQQRSVGQTKSGPSTNRAEGSSDSAFLAAENLDVSHILSPSSSYPPPKKSKPDPKKKTSNVDIVRMIEKVTESVESAVRPKDDISHFTKSLEGDIRKVAPQRLTKLKLDIMKAVFDAQQPERQQESFTPSTAQYPSIFYTTQSSNYPQRLSSPQASTNSFAILSNQSSPYTYAPGYPHSAFYYQAPQSSQTRFTSHPTFERLPPTGHSTNESQGSPLQTQSRSSTPLPEDIGQNVRGAKN